MTEAQSAWARDIAHLLHPYTNPRAHESQGPFIVTSGKGVTVTDADGKVLLSALKRSGERIELTGKAPIKLHLGFARGAQVTYNGENVDVTPHISGETARLTLGL